MKSFINDNVLLSNYFSIQTALIKFITIQIIKQHF